MAAPVGVTQALPGFSASAMYTARVGDALVTVLALPAIQTPARHTESHAVSLRSEAIHISPNTHTCHRNTCRTFTQTVPKRSRKPCGTQETRISPSATFLHRQYSNNLSLIN